MESSEQTGDYIYSPICTDFWQVAFFHLVLSEYVNPLNPKIKIKILICRPYSFPREVVRRSL